VLVRVVPAAPPVVAVVSWRPSRRTVVAAVAIVVSIPALALAFRLGQEHAGLAWFRP
jgi:hypothetical protein